MRTLKEIKDWKKGGSYWVWVPVEKVPVEAKGAEK
jgi:hypothetical protein